MSKKKLKPQYTKEKKENKSIKALKAILIIAIFLALASAGYFGYKCYQKIQLEKQLEAQKLAELTSPINPKDFVLGDYSKVIISIEGNREYNVTENVVAYNNSDLCLDIDGLNMVFGLAREPATEEDIELYKEATGQEGSLASEVIKLIGMDKTFLFGVGASAYTVNGRVSHLKSPVAVIDGRLSIPIIPTIPIDLGYSRFDESVTADTVTYTLHKN